MSRLFGWDYPPGAEFDPRAPYNQSDDPCWCGHFHEDHEVTGGKCLEPGCSCPAYEAPSDVPEDDDLRDDLEGEVAA